MYIYMCKYIFIISTNFILSLYKYLKYYIIKILLYRYYKGNILVINKCNINEHIF